MVLDALFYRMRNAGPWRDLPEGFGPWRTIYGWHRLWAREGLWARMLARMARKVRNRIRLVDGTHVRVHQCAANPKGGAAAQAMGKTRGGRNSKIMALTDVRGLPVKLSLIEGQAYEGHHVIELLDDPRGLMVVGTKASTMTSCASSSKKLGPSTASRANPTAKRSAGSTRSSTGSATVWRTSSAVSNAGPAPAPGATSLRCTFFPSSSSPPSSTGSDTAVEGFQTRPRCYHRH